MTNNANLIEKLEHSHGGVPCIATAEIRRLMAEIDRKKAVLSKAHDALAFAYNDCESDYVRDEKIDPVMDAIQKELT